MGDGLPQSICKNCTDKLMVCQDFWIQCQSATEILNTILADHLKNEVEREEGTEIVYLVVALSQTKFRLYVVDRSNFC